LPHLYVIVQFCENNPCGENLHCGDPLIVQPSKIVQFVTPPVSYRFISLIALPFWQYTAFQLSHEILRCSSEPETCTSGH